MSEDIFLWPDGSWCYRYDAYQFGHKSDYEVIKYGTPAWHEFVRLHT